jgi:hypothetical protein
VEEKEDLIEGMRISVTHNKKDSGEEEIEIKS